MDSKTAFKDVQVMLGDPKKALLAFSLPIAVALFVQQSNNLVDSFWVTNLGGDAMAALGLVYPIYAVLIGIGNGLGIGVAAAIARKIGMGKNEVASRIATQSITLVIIVSIVATPILILGGEPILKLIGAGATLATSIEYAFPLYLSTGLIIMSGVMSGILRGEGAVRKSMYIQIVAAVINLVLDPIFIYTLGWGVAGAAWATTISFAASVIMGLYWYCIKKNMFLTMKWAYLRFNKACQKEILSVGFPESVEFSAMNLFNIAYNFCIITVSSTDVMGLYTVAWRIMYLLMIPAQAMGGAIVSACSAEFGMKRYDMIKQAYSYATKFSVSWLILFAVILFAAAGMVASVFTQSPDVQYLHGDMVSMLHILVWVVPFMAPIYVGSSLLQALNRSKVALVSTVIRNSVLTVFFFVAAYTVGTESSLWWAMVSGEVFGGLLMGYWAYVVLKDSSRKDGIKISG
ncbi:MAG: MATE family efflux transporter [Candidatus Methanoplasma sp.]|jgi:putative MATE family efflux protein|nr:MATE family efflux transporter [Candidatus Methanoplasma sp.]